MVTVSLPGSSKIHIKGTLLCQILHIPFRFPPVYGVPDAGMWMVFEEHHTAKGTTADGHTVDAVS